jgi:hypothetical protein
MDDSDDESIGAVVDRGRKKHLGRLALVFYHRGATWQDLGTFLEDLFSGALHKKGKGFHVQKCRHAPSGRHYGVLQSAAQAPDQYPMFNHDRYSHPCLSFGKGERGKATGMIVSDICTRARVFLESIGKGVIKRHSGTDEDNDPDTEAELEGQIPSRVRSPEGPEDNATTNLPSDMSSEDEFGPWDLTEEDIEGIFEEPEAERTITAGTDILMSELSDFPSSELSGDPTDRRSTTKMRVATLAYLWKFSRAPASLRMAFRTLRQGDDSVLHLCGCGQFFINANGESCSGCVERSHLKLGSLEENRRHLIWHKAFGQARLRDYPQLVGIAHRAPGGEGLF